MGKSADDEVRNMIREGDTVLTPSGREGTVMARRAVHQSCVVLPHDGSETMVEWTDKLVKREF